MKEVEHALFLAVALSIAKEKASAGNSLAIERKEEKMFAIFRNINKGRRHYRRTQLTCSDTHSFDSLQKSDFLAFSNKHVLRDNSECQLFGRVT